jgi:hypothetical protein
MNATVADKGLQIPQHQADYTLAAKRLGMKK